MIPLLLMLAADLPRIELEHGMSLQAEYLVHSIPALGGELIANDYLVMDATMLGPKNSLDVSIAHFKIRLNGKTVIDAENPGAVANAMMYPEYNSRGTVDAVAGPMVISSRPSAPRFPGDPTPGVPGQTREGPAPGSPMSLEQRVKAAAIREGDQTPPVRGLLFFEYRGKTKKIKSLELLYEGPAGKAALKLF